MGSKALKRMTLLLVVGVMVLGSVSAAMAQDDTTDDAYPPPEPPRSSLPMSGLDIALIALGGTLMLAAGVGMRRVVRNR